jgi:hypothetical protein
VRDRVNRSFASRVCRSGVIDVLFCLRASLFVWAFHLFAPRFPPCCAQFAIDISLSAEHHAPSRNTQTKPASCELFDAAVVASTNLLFSSFEISDAS